MTLDRIRQLRDVILERRAENERSALRSREIELQVLISHIRSANGDESAAKAAKSVHLLKRPADAPKRVRPIPADRVGSLFSGT